MSNKGKEIEQTSYYVYPDTYSWVLYKKYVNKKGETKSVAGGYYKTREAAYKALLEVTINEEIREVNPSIELSPEHMEFLIGVGEKALARVEEALKEETCTRQD